MVEHGLVTQAPLLTRIQEPWTGATPTATTATPMISVAPDLDTGKALTNSVVPATETLLATADLHMALVRALLSDSLPEAITGLA